MMAHVRTVWRGNGRILIAGNFLPRTELTGNVQCAESGVHSALSSPVMAEPADRRSCADTSEYRRHL